MPSIVTKALEEQMKMIAGQQNPFASGIAKAADMPVYRDVNTSRRTIAESIREIAALADQVERINHFATTVLSSFRGSSPEKVSGNIPPAPTSIVDDLSRTIDRLALGLRELQENFESFDYHIGTGYSMPLAAVPPEKQFFVNEPTNGPSRNPSR
jgi:hypothetical protein